MKKVYKYGTGHPIPEGAVYLCTKVQRKIEITKKARDVMGRYQDEIKWIKCWLVWHYFLVEVEEDK